MHSNTSSETLLNPLVEEDSETSNENKKTTIIAETNKLTITTCLHFGYIIFLSLVIVGISPGYAGIRQFLLDQKVFFNLCPQGEGECAEQQAQIGIVANMSLSLLNLVSFVVGVVYNLIGGRVSGVLGTVLWTIFFCISGVSPEIGWIWAIGFAGYTMSCCMIFFAILFEYIPVLFNHNPTHVGRAVALMTGAWDAASATFVLLSFIGNFFNLSLFELCLGYGLIIGIPAVVYLQWQYPIVCFKREEQGGGKESEGKETCGTMKQQISRLFDFFTTPFYWLYVADAVSVVTYGYIWIPEVVAHMKSHGVSETEAKHYNSIFAILLPVVGCVGSCIAAFTINFEKRSTVVAILLIQAGLAVAVLVFATLPTSVDPRLQYITFCCAIAWRMTSFCFINGSFHAVFPHSISTSKAYAIAFCVGGAVGATLGSWICKQVEATPPVFYTAHIGLASFAVVVALSMAAMVPRALNEKSQCIAFLQKQGL